MCIHGPKNSYLGKSTPHPLGQETIPILSLGASPLGIELELPLGPRDIGVDFPRYEFLSPWIPPRSSVCCKIAFLRACAMPVTKGAATPVITRFLTFRDLSFPRGYYTNL